jgi:hypothetical protein
MPTPPAGDRLDIGLEDKLNVGPALYQGTTLVVPQMPEDKGRALAPEGKPIRNEK